MKKQLHLLILLLASLCIQAQNQTKDKVTYGYDAAGNRIKREIVVNTTKSAVESPSVFTEEFAERIIKIYPNPTQGFLKVELSDFDKAKTVTLHLLNMSGQSILKTKMATNPTDLDISNRPSGIYILQIIIDGKISTWRIIKE